MEESGEGGNRKFREDANSPSCGKLPPVVPITQAPPQVDGIGVRTGRRHVRPSCGVPLIANMPITEILHGLSTLAKLNIQQSFMKYLGDALGFAAQSRKKAVVADRLS
jgi:hypothetical protein